MTGPLHFAAPGCCLAEFIAEVPDPHVNDRGFHDVTILDMGDSAGPVVPVTDLSLLRLQWPVSIINSHGCNRNSNVCGQHQNNATGTLLQLPVRSAESG